MLLILIMYKIFNKFEQLLEELLPKIINEKLFKITMFKQL